MGFTAEDVRHYVATGPSQFHQHLMSSFCADIFGPEKV
jgi:hypothetical protein